MSNEVKRFKAPPPLNRGSQWPEMIEVVAAEDHDSIVAELTAEFDEYKTELKKQLEFIANQAQEIAELEREVENMHSYAASLAIELTDQSLASASIVAELKRAAEINWHKWNYTELEETIDEQTKIIRSTEERELKQLNEIAQLKVELAGTEVNLKLIRSVLTLTEKAEDKLEKELETARRVIEKLKALLLRESSKSDWKVEAEIEAIERGE